MKLTNSECSAFNEAANALMEGPVAPRIVNKLLNIIDRLAAPDEGKRAAAEYRCVNCKREWSVIEASYHPGSNWRACPSCGAGCLEIDEAPKAEPPRDGEWPDPKLFTPMSDDEMHRLFHTVGRAFVDPKTVMRLIVTARVNAPRTAPEPIPPLDGEGRGYQEQTKVDAEAEAAKPVDGEVAEAVAYFEARLSETGQAYSVNTAKYLRVIIAKLRERERGPVVDEDELADAILEASRAYQWLSASERTQSHAHFIAKHIASNLLTTPPKQEGLTREEIEAAMVEASWSSTSGSGLTAPSHYSRVFISQAADTIIAAQSAKAALSKGER